MSLGGREEPEKQTDIDRRFAEIVAQLGPADGMWDASLDETEAAEAADSQPASDDSPNPSESEALLDELPTQWRVPPSGSASMFDEDDTFVPAPPRPLPSGDEDIGFWAMVACLIGGPSWLLYLFFFDQYAQSLWWVLACALFVAGVVQLVMRSPKNRDELDDDDGAVL